MNKKKEPRIFHHESGGIVFDKPKSQEQITLETRAREQHEFARDQVQTNKRLTGLNALLVLGTFIGSGIAIWQGRISQAAANAADRAAKASQESAYDSCEGARIARSALIEAQTSESETHGAAVAAVYQAMAATEGERADMQLILDQPVIEPYAFTLPFVTRNSGKTAAIDLNFVFSLVFLTHGKDPDFAYPQNQVTHGFNPRAEPGPDPGFNGKHGFAVIGTDGKEVVPTNQDLIDLRSGKKDLVLYGKMNYRDIFGASHWRNFCQPFHNGTEGLDSENVYQKCARYNQSDLGSALVKAAPPPAKSAPIEEITCKKPD